MSNIKVTFGTKRKLVIGCGIFLVLLFLMSVLSPLILLCSEDTLVKEELNNRYIDSNYDGWNAISIGVIESFMIPEEWEMMESEGIMLITNNGDEIGYAALLGKNRKVQDTHAFFNILAPDQTCTIEREVIDDVLQIDASYFFRAEMEGKSLNRSLYCIYLYDDYDYQFILALNENCYEYSSICDIAEAIIYSFTLLEK